MVYKRFKKSLITALVLTLVATFNCCLPKTLAYHENPSHSVSESEACPVSEKPDLDAIQSSTLSSTEKEKVALQDFCKNKLERSLAFPLKVQATQYHKTVAPTIKVILWGSNSSQSSNVYRL